MGAQTFINALSRSPEGCLCFSVTGCMLGKKLVSCLVLVFKLHCDERKPIAYAHYIHLFLINL